MGRSAKAKRARFNEQPPSESVKKPFILNELASHFRTIPLNQIVTASREYPVAARVDLEGALTYILGETYPSRLIGVHRVQTRGNLTFSDLLDVDHDPVLIAPLQYAEIDIGEAIPARCLQQGVWLVRSEEIAFAVLLTPIERGGRDIGSRVEIAVPAGEQGAKISRTVLDYVEKLVNEGRSYRGKLISLEPLDRVGHVGALKVHKFRPIKREEIILPEQTLRLLEQNLVYLIHQRDKLKKLGMATKKGLLFYGPPGSGKTHTIHYLASQLPGHTTLWVTAEQVGLLDHYFQLARLLQPTMLVIEDVDLIARESEVHSGTESVLNKLLTEMDRMPEDSASLFILTTSHPEALEATLAARPGQIDQAIEFPLPDEEGRKKLVRLYARGLQLSEQLIEITARKTNQMSAAFIKELMRRAAQYLLATSDDVNLLQKHVESALDEMLARGGHLNLKVLGVTPEKSAH